MGSSKPSSLITACILGAMLASPVVSSVRAERDDLSTSFPPADKLFEVSRSHMGVEGIRRVMIQKGEQWESDYELADRARFATSLVDRTGSLLQFSVNSPDNQRDYKPIKDRAAFIRKVLQILSPETPAAERYWAVSQLDDPVRQWTPSFPIVVGSFVYRLHRANMHDHFEVTAADSTTSGRRYGKR